MRVLLPRQQKDCAIGQDSDSWTGPIGPVKERMCEALYYMELYSGFVEDVYVALGPQSLARDH